MLALYSFNMVFIFPLLQDEKGIDEQNQGLGLQMAVFHRKKYECCE